MPDSDPHTVGYDDPLRRLASEQAARADSDAAAEVMRALESITERAFADLPVRHLSLTVVERVVERMGAEGGVLFAGGELEPLTSVSIRDGAGVSEAGHVPPEEAARLLALGRLQAGRGTVDGTLHPLLEEVLAALGGEYVVASVPVEVGDRQLGVLAVYRVADEPFRRDEVGLLQLASDRVGLALDRASAGERERRARADAEQSRDRIDRLQRVTAALPGLTDEVAIGEVLLQETVTVLGAASGAVYVASELSATLQRVAVLGCADDAGWPHANPDALPLVHAGSAATATREGRLIDQREPPQDSTDGAAAPPARADGAPARVAIPLLRAGGAASGALVLGFDDVPQDLDVDWLQSVARQGAQAFERARLARERARMYESERAARAQAEERAQAARILEGISDGVLLIDRRGYVRSWNAAAASITGLSSRSVVGRRLDAVLPGIHAVLSQVPVDVDPRSPSSRELLPFELPGRELWVSASAMTTRDGTVLAFRDVTEERIVERMRTELVATVSHELRTPLAGMVGAIQTLLRDDLELDAGTQHQLLELLDTQTTRLGRIVDDMLQVNRLDTGNEQVERATFDLAALLRRRAGERPALSSSGDRSLVAAMPVVVEAPEVLEVVADEARVAQIVDNLLDNARAYASGSPTVDVTASRSDHGTACVHVRDHGPGIPPGEHDRIFEKFYRLDPDMRRDVGGNGLGLYICRRLAERMGGSIRLDRDVVDGTEFVLELPLAGAQEGT